MYIKECYLVIDTQFQAFWNFGYVWMATHLIPFTIGFVEKLHLSETQSAQKIYEQLSGIAK